MQQGPQHGQRCLLAARELQGGAMTCGELWQQRPGREISVG